MRSVKAIAWIAAAVLWGCLVSGCSSSDHGVKAASVKESGKRNPAPDFSLRDVDGKVVRLSDFKGKVVLLDFWATWCGPCKIEIPWFTEFERKHKDKGFAVIGVSMDEEGWDVVRPFLAHMNVNYRVVIGNDTTAQAYGGIDALPTTFLIDREGRIAATHVGLTSKNDIENGIEQLLGVASVQAGGGGHGRVALPAFALRAR
jgi:cytochrome c biogenesis protein CcmG/thiol:disulfide interchange protein DsbE